MSLSRTGFCAATGLLGLIISTGCQSKLQNENKALWAQNRELQADKNRLQSDLASRPDPAQMQAMQQQIAERDAKIAELQNQLRQPPPPVAGAPASQDNALQGIEVTRDDRAGTVTVNLPG